MKRIAVLITCHNRKEKTIKCLSHLFEQVGINEDFELNVFLVDDKCTDGTSDSVKEIFPQVNIIEGTGSLYWNRGMHLAWKTARNFYDFSHFLWLNDDTMLHDNAIKELLYCESITKGGAIICGVVCSAITNTYTYGGKTFEGKDIIPNGDVQYCQILNGNCVLVNKNITDKIGILDPVYPHAIGDHDYGFKTIRGGFSIAITRCFIGNCENNPKLPKWCYSSTPLFDRLNALYSPLGYSHPKYFFIYEYRYYGLMTAIKHYFTIHLRALIPILWK